MTEGERIIKLETQMTNFDQKLDDVKESVQEVKDIITTFIENSDRKFASKWVEKVVWGVASIIGTTVVLAVLSLIFHK